MKKRIILLILILGITGVSGIFAQGFVKGSFCLGLVGVGGDKKVKGAGFGGDVDIDIVNSFGFTIGVKLVEGFALGDGVVVAPGLGYTYNGGSWSAGAKFMMTVLGYATPGIDFNGSYWFFDNFGINADLGFLFGHKFTCYMLTVGVTARR